MKPRSSYDVVVFDSGPVYLDLIFEGLPSLPRLGSELFSKNFSISPGGSFNTSVAMARLGLKVALIAQSGEDFFSRWLRTQLDDQGVDTSHFMMRPGPARAVTVSLTYPNDRAFVSYRDGRNTFDFPEGLMSPRRTGAVLFTALLREPAGLRLARRLRNAGLKTAMDAHNPWGSVEEAALKRSLGLADLLIPNAEEARLLSGTGDLDEALVRLARIVPEVTIKNGGEGALGWRKGERAFVPAIRSRVVDTTGAGDCFNAGFLSGWIEGLPLADCLARGNVCGGLSVRVAGGSAGAPDRARLETELARLTRRRRI